jgi:hypothetical protein
VTGVFAFIRMKSRERINDVHAPNPCLAHTGRRVVEGTPQGPIMWCGGRLSVLGDIEKQESIGEWDRLRAQLFDFGESRRWIDLPCLPNWLILQLP